MPEKPTYLGLLNGISVAESRAHHYFTAWIAKSDNPAVKEVLRTVAAREGEHGLAFAKRINELGYELQQTASAKDEERIAIASSDLSDVEKMEKLGVHELETCGLLDYFDNVFKDHTIDVRTGELLGRYIAEEHDTARRLGACYRELKAAGTASSATATATAATQLSALDEKVDALCRAVEELRQIVCAQSMPAGTG